MPDKCQVCSKPIPAGSQWPMCCSKDCYRSQFVPKCPACKHQQHLPNMCDCGCWTVSEIPVTPEELSKAGTRSDKGKPRVDLIPPEVLIELGKLYEMGARKYSPDNWRRGMAYSRMYASTMRHLLAFWSGEDFDPTDGQHHLDAVIWGAVGLRYFELYPDKYGEFDDRYTIPYPDPESVMWQVTVDGIDYRSLGPDEVIKENDWVLTGCDSKGMILSSVPKTKEFVGPAKNAPIPVYRIYAKGEHNDAKSDK